MMKYLKEEQVDMQRQELRQRFQRASASAFENGLNKPFLIGSLLLAGAAAPFSLAAAAMIAAAPVVYLGAGLAFGVSARALEHQPKPPKP